MPRPAPRDDIWPRIRREWGAQNVEKAGAPVGAAKTAATAGASVAEAFGKAMQMAKGG